MIQRFKKTSALLHSIIVIVIVGWSLLLFTSRALAISDAICPAGARVRGKAPPKGTKIWCEKPSQKKKGLFLRHGKITEWYSNGTLKLEGEFWNDMKEGKWVEYHSNGLAEKHYEYLKGTRIGKWTEWYRNGQLRQQEEFENGRKSGKFIEWYKSGLKKTEGSFKDGKEDGKWMFWNKDGSLKDSLFYEQGKVIDKPRELE